MGSGEIHGYVHIVYGAVESPININIGFVVQQCKSPSLGLGVSAFNKKYLSLFRLIRASTLFCTSSILIYQTVPGTRVP